ncbi:MAG: hypothetical protein ABSH39_23050 [Candidatus Acidiferrum sp.]
MKLLALCLLSIAALAQSSGVCYNDSEDKDTRICEYSDGGARTDTVIGSYHSFHTYTAPQWKAKKASIERMRKSAACTKASDAMSDELVNSSAWLAASKVEAKACGRY